MKHKLTALVSIILVMLFVTPGIANTPVIVYIDGKLLQSDVPAQIIDGRTMVPLAAIAQGFNSDVKWNPDSQTVAITSLGKTPQPIDVTGPDDFKELVGESLNTMDDATLSFVARYIRQIVYENPLNIMDATDKAAMYPDGVCRFNGIYFESIKNKLSRNELVYGYLGYLAHEASHASIVLSGEEGMYSEQDREALCEIAACKAIARAGGSNSNSYATFKKSLQKQLQY